MNCIFDIGRVLINFEPEQFLHGLFDDPVLEKELKRIIFKSDEWVKLDQGVITQEEACANFCRREPQYRAVIAGTMERLPEMLTPITETIELLPKIKESGHRLYYLSNFHKELSRYVLSVYPFFRLFDGGVFSCDVRILKPSPEIYRCLLNKYGLDPRDCLFFDDVEENVRSAEAQGIRGVLFTGTQVVAELITPHDPYRQAGR